MDKKIIDCGLGIFFVNGPLSIVDSRFNFLVLVAVDSRLWTVDRPLSITQFSLVVIHPFL